MAAWQVTVTIKMRLLPTICPEVLDYSRLFIINKRHALNPFILTFTIGVKLTPVTTCVLEAPVSLSIHTVDHNMP